MTTSYYPKAGLVVANNDPDKTLRVKVRVPYVHDDVPDDMLPWAVCLGGSAKGANYGIVSVPAVGSLVAVYFQDNDPMNPAYSGGVPSVGGLPPSLLENYPNRHGLYLPNGALAYFDVTTKRLVIENPGDLQVTISGNANISVTGDLAVICGGQASVTATRIDLN